MLVRILLLMMLPLTAPAETIAYQHAYGFLTQPKYPANFSHFDYLNPNAPKGGRIRSPQMGNWDNFNPITAKGREAAGIDFWGRDRNLLWDSLLVPSLDEPETHYGLIASGVAVAADRSWVAFKLRENARFHDGAPITVNDVKFTFEALKSDSADPAISGAFKHFTIEVINTHEVRFFVPPNLRDDPTIPVRLGGLPVLPAHYWADRDLAKTTVEPPLGSGPYRIGEFAVGRWVEFHRVEDYWAKDLPVNRGKYNFDQVKYDYFRDDQVQTEAVKGNIIDVHVENVPRTWYASYDIPAVADGVLRKTELKLARPAGLWWPIFWNMSQPRFQDIRVRKALWLINDMDWQNQRSYNFWGHATSFFHDSELAATGLPNEKEMALLSPWRGKIPESVFAEPYQPQPNTGNGWSRENIVEAARLLKEAGWVIEENLLIHEDTRNTFHIRLVAVSPALGRSFIPLTHNLKRLGITSSIKSPEISNWLYRMRSGDFDGGAIWFLPNFTPTLLVNNTFHSSQAERAYGANWSNLKDPAIDAMIEASSQARTWEDYVAALRAFDRIMLHNYYWLPMMSKTRHALAYWDKFSWHPHGRLTRLAHLDTWWYDEEKARLVDAYTGGDD